MKRREILQLAGASAATLAAPTIVRAQTKRFEGITIRTNGYGGDYDRILKEYGGDPTLTDWAGRTADDYQRLRLSTYPPSASLSRALEPHGPSRAQ